MSADASATKAGRLRTAAAATLESFVALLLLLALLDMLLQVGARVLFPSGAPDWTEEAARILLIWISFFGAAAASMRGLHLVVDLFLLSTHVRRAWDIAIAVAVSALSVSLLYGVTELIQFSARSRTPGLGWPGYVFYLPLFAFAAITLLSAIADGVALIRHGAEPDGGQVITPTVGAGLSDPTDPKHK